MNLDTTSCRRAVGEGGGGGCFQGGPLWLQQASVTPAAPTPHPNTLHPHPRHPLCPPPSRSLAWQTGSLPGSASKWQPCGSPEGLVRVWPRGSSSLHAPPRGLTLDHDTYRDTRSAEAVQAGWVTEVEAAASAHYGRSPPPTKHYTPQK